MKDTYHVRHGPTIAAFAHLMEFDTGWCVTELFVTKPNRGEGLGSRLLEMILEDADEEGETLILEPKPFGGGDMDRSDLTDWYTRHGFEYADGGYLIRYPE